MVKKLSYGKNSDDSDFFLPVIEYMNKNYNRYITTSELAKLLYVHPSYLIRKFKAVYGIPPHAYFSTIKIKKATELLSSTDSSVKEVSKKLGIDDATYFSRWFKKYNGFSPTEYRKKLKNN